MCQEKEQALATLLTLNDGTDARYKKDWTKGNRRRFAKPTLGREGQGDIPHSSRRGNCTKGPHGATAKGGGATSAFRGRQGAK